MGRPARRSQVDWSIIFDSIASEYGYTWDQFTGMTYKMLDVCLEAISRRTHNKNAVLAAMHGIKIDLYRRIKSPSSKDLEKGRSEAFKILQEKQAAAQNG